MDYIEVSFEIDPFCEEIAEWVVAEAGDRGFESFVTENSVLKAYIQKQFFSESILDEIRDIFEDLPTAEIRIRWKEFENKNWNAIWESQFEPIVIPGKLNIRAPFHKDLPAAEYEIVIEPKMAFGTGHHQTTMMMVQHLLDMKSLNGRKVLDMGCGTGILAILASKLGAEAPVRAIDIDDIAADSAVENAQVNGAELKVSCGDASIIEKDAYDILLANINRNILLNDMPVYAAALHPEGLLLVSGFYEKDVELLKDRAKEFGLGYVGMASKEEWASVKFVKKI